MQTELECIPAFVIIIKDSVNSVPLSLSFSCVHKLETCASSPERWQRNNFAELHISLLGKMTHSSPVFTIICPEQPVWLCYDCSIMVSLTFTEIRPQKTRQGHTVKSILSWKEILTGLLVVLQMGCFSKWLLQMSPLSVSYLPVVLQTGHLFQFPSSLQHFNLLINCLSHQS